MRRCTNAVRLADTNILLYAVSAINLCKAVASEGYYEACNFAHEVHAGVGSMTEYGLTLHTAASRTLYHFLGDPKQHRRELATALGL